MNRRKTVLNLILVFFTLITISCGENTRKKIQKFSQDEIQKSKFTDIANVDTEPCSNNFVLIQNCHNIQNPIPPSIEKNFEAANAHFNYYAGFFDPSVTPRLIDQLAFPFEYKWDANFNANNYPPQKDQMHTLPYNGVSNDGRLAFNGSNIQVFRPESTDYDLIGTKGFGYDNAPNSRTRGVFLLHMMNPLNTNFKWSTSDYSWTEGKPNNGTPGTTLCDGSYNIDPDNNKFKRNPRQCYAKNKASDNYIPGDCYDISFISIYEASGGNFEIRSAPKTIFVNNGKSTLAAGDNASKIFIYPRLDENLIHLPAYEDYHVHWNAGVEEAQVCLNNNPPKWCLHLSQQKTVQNFTNWNGSIQADSNEYYHFDWNGNGVMDAGEEWSGYTGGGQGRRPSEPTITGDGLLLIVHDTTGKGLLYSMNEIGPCRADGWKTFKPLSHMYNDPLVSKYGLAKVQHRDVRNKNYAPGNLMRGAYPWISRKGDNLFYSKATYGDSYRADEQIPSAGFQENLNNVDFYPGMRKSASLVFVIGSYTRGKEISTDTRLSYTSFGGRIVSFGNDANTAMTNGESISGWTPYQYKMNLYNDDSLTNIMPRPNTRINSLENVLNHYDAISPTMPFDVVWRLSSNAEQNAEIIFDDYSNKNAVIVAHMNAAIKRNYDGTSRILNGFTSDNPSANMEAGERGYFTYTESPKLQNAATAKFLSMPRELKLLGGARIEPINNGVVGKALFLDGKNDHAKAQFNSNQLDDFLLTIWLENLAENEDEYRGIFEFHDKSFIAISKKKLMISTYPKKIGTRKIELIDLNSGLDSSKFFHLAVNSTMKYNNEGKEIGRDFTIFINGTELKTKRETIYVKSNLAEVLPDNHVDVKPLALPLINKKIGAGFKFKGNGYFVLGSSERSYDRYGLKPFKGWIDEFRLFNVAIKNSQNHFLRENICNYALGSLVRVVDKDLTSAPHPKLQLLAFKATQYNLIPKKVKPIPGPQVSHQAYVCEQLDFRKNDYPSELPPQSRDQIICANRVHRNPLKHPGMYNRCSRKQIYGLANFNLTANEPRPDTSQNQFCLSCHTDQSDTLALKVAALTMNSSVNRMHDLRRQPMEHVAVTQGCIPEGANAIGNITTSNNCEQIPVGIDSEWRVNMDMFFDGVGKKIPPQ